MKNIVQRTISGVLYLILIIGSLYLGKFAFGIIVLFFSTIALYEFYRLANGSDLTPLMVIGLVVGALLIISAFLVFSGMCNPVCLSFNLAFILFLFLAGLFSNQQKGIQNLAITLLGIVYVSLPLAFNSYIIFPESYQYEYTHHIMLGILMMIWVNDTGAYVIGITIGRHRLFERISPRKSWEGAIGGTLLTVALGLWMKDIMHSLTKTDWLILAGIVSVFGVLGDLFESMLKRNMHVKDSGTVIPGHGGILDRIDSMLFIIPVAYIYLIINKI